MMKFFLACLIGLVCCVAPGFAVEVQQGQLYEAGTQVASSEAGVSLTIPAGWKGAWPHGAEMFLLQRDVGTAVMLLYIDVGNAEGLLEKMSQPIPIDGVTLSPTAPPTQRGEIWVADYALSPAANGMEVGHIATRVGSGVSVAVIGLGAAVDATVAKSTDQLARAMTLRAPVATPAPTVSEGSWAAYLQGRHIVRFYTQTGYTEETHLWLCSDGSFQRSGQGGGFGGGASGAYQGAGHGTWTAQGAQRGTGRLVLTWATGGTATLEVSMVDDKLHVDGVQWLRDANDRCS